jgi:hypothetical protein
MTGDPFPPDVVRALKEALDMSNAPRSLEGLSHSEAMEAIRVCQEKVRKAQRILSQFLADRADGGGPTSN